jgi:hypothetical protein
MLLRWHPFRFHGFDKKDSLRFERPTVGISCGGWRGEIRHRNGKSLKPRKSLKNAPRTHRQLHAVLGGVPERQTLSLNKASTARLTILWHVPLLFSTDKHHNLPTHLRCKDASRTKNDLATETEMDE